MARNVPRRLAHLLERSGLALVGAATGLFVGIHTGASIPAFTNTGYLLVLTIVGALGYYLGIDTPPHRFRSVAVDLPGNSLDSGIDVSEMLTAFGTFLAALSTFISVAMIMVALDATTALAVTLLAVWGVGTLMQVVAGALARWQD